MGSFEVFVIKTDNAVGKNRGLRQVRGWPILPGPTGFQASSVKRASKSPRCVVYVRVHAEKLMHRQTRWIVLLEQLDKRLLAGTPLDDGEDQLGHDPGIFPGLAGSNTPTR
jgi:hypothetical protein